MSSEAKRYNAVAILLHWAIFVLLVITVRIGWSAEDLDKAARLQAMQFHKSFGLTILLLSVFRLVWRHINPPPAPPANMSARDLLIMKLTHIAFYGLMLGIPLLGWLLISTSGYKFPTMFWGMFEWPVLPLSEQSFSKPLHEVAEFLHSKFVWLGIVLMVLHVAAALKHQFVDKDGILGRMIPFIK